MLVEVEGEILAPTFFGRTCVRRSAVRGDLHEHQRIALSCAFAHRSFVRSLDRAFLLPPSKANRRSPDLRPHRCRRAHLTTMFKPTPALQGTLRRLPLSTKQAGKEYYKGNRVGSMGTINRYGNFTPDWNKIRTYVFPVHGVKNAEVRTDTPSNTTTSSS